MENNIFYEAKEEILGQDYVVVSYYLELSSSTDPYEKAKMMAVGQTIGTWIPVPGITDEMRKNHMGKVINIYDLETSDLSSGLQEAKKKYIFQIAYPTINFDDRLPLLLTTILGNDASTSVQAKVIDLYVPKNLVRQLPGAAYGIEGIRELVGEKERPLLLNMIKPCIGFSAETGAKIFYETALGGVDFIKDDELLGNPSFCPLEKRVKAYTEASRAAYEITGKETIYIPNITDHVANLLENAERAVEAGARIIMVNFSAVGISALQMLRERIRVPIMGHYATSGPFYEGALSGMASDIILGKLPRLAGADIVMINTPYGGYPIKRSMYLKTALALTLPLYEKKPVLPSLGGGVNPGIVHRIIDDLGTNIMLAPGGAVQGHPMGPAAGIRAMQKAIDAKLSGRTLDEAEKSSPELRAAEYMWRKDKKE